MIKILEIGATIFGLLQGILIMFNKRSNWIAYIIQMFLMILFSMTMHLYGDVLNSSFYLIVGIVGFIIWNRKKENDIKKCSMREKVFYIIFISVATAGFAIILKNTNDPLPVLDAFTTVSSFTATYYMMIKKLDAWIIWFINDIFYALEYFLLPNQAVYLFLLNIIWTGMAIATYINWSKIMKEKKNEKNILCRKI